MKRHSLTLLACLVFVLFVGLSWTGYPECLYPARDHVHGRQYHHVLEPQPDQRLHGRVLLRPRGVYGRGSLCRLSSNRLVLHEGIGLRGKPPASRMVDLPIPLHPSLRRNRCGPGRIDGGHPFLSNPRRLPGDHHAGRKLHRQKRHRKHPGDRGGPGIHGNGQGRH